MGQGSVMTGESSSSQSRLMVFMFTDVADSTRLKQPGSFGAAAYAELARKHDELFRQIAASIPSADLLKDLGDGFMATFATASDAVRAALRFQFAINTDPDFSPAFSPARFRVRVGIHQGEVSVLDLDIHGKPKLVGPAADMTARIQSLALPGQILVSRAAFDNARQYVREHPVCGEGTACPVLCWEAHGYYRFIGIPDPQEVFEVGAKGSSPCKEPAKTEKAWYVGSPDDEAMRGWRPALGQAIPRRAGWVLEKKIGDGGFGEVWLASHKNTKEWRVFKFCFSPDRLRSFKREMTLFRLIRDALGNRNDIARLYDISLESPPYLLESQYEPGGNLLDWAGKQGGIAKVPLAVRLDLIIRIAEAVAAAHSVGILHKDLKPSNILIRDEDGHPRPVLADFGIGILTDRSRLNDLKITEAGFTQSLLTDNESSRTGTRMYAPPESTAGKTFTTAGDVYALGVILYQMVAADLERPIGEGWQRDVPDELVREDIASAVDGDPARRTPGAALLGQKLRELDGRRMEKARVEAALKAAKRRNRLARIGLYVAVVACIAFVMVNRARQEAIKQASDSDYRLGNLLATENEDSEALAYLARALQANPANQNAMVLSIAILYRHPVPLIELRQNGSAVSASFSPDGKSVIAASDDGSVQMWDLTSGKRVGGSVRPRGNVKSASFSPDGKLVITVCDNGVVQIWDVADGMRPVREMRPGLTINSASFSPDGTQVVTACDDRTARIWDAATGKQERKSMWHEGPVNSASFNPDSTRVVTASADKKARVWDWSSGQCKCEMLHGGEVKSASFSLDGLRVVTASEDKTARVWDAKNGSPLCDPMWHDGPVNSASFSQDGLRVVTASEDGTARVWDAADGKQLGAPMRCQGPVNSASFNWDGSRVVTASRDGIVRIWDAASGEPLCEPMRHEAAVTSASFSPDGSRVVTICDGVACEWDTAKNQMVRELARPGIGVLSAEFSRDGTKLVTADSDGAAQIWLATNGESVGGPMTLHQGARSASFSPDGKRVVTIGADKKVQIWDSATAALHGDPISHDRPINSVSFSPDGLWIVTASDDNTAGIWDADGRPWYKLAPHGAPVNSATFSPDGSIVVTASNDDTARVWDAHTGKPFGSGEPMRHGGPVHYASFSPDGSRIVTASEDHTARVWDAATGEPLGEPMRHGGDVRSAFFSPDGLRVVTASDDNTAQIWDATSGKPLGEPMRDTARVTTASFSPDGTRVLLAGEDRTAKVLDVAIVGSASPLWLAALDEWAAGQRFETNGVTVYLGDERKKLRTELDMQAKSLSANDPQGRWLRWFLADPRHRTISPLSDETTSDYVQRRIDDRKATLDSLRETVELEPGNPQALARLASYLVQNKNANAEQAGREIYVSLYTRCAAEISATVQKNSRTGSPADQPAFSGQ
jgi:WD40 repeat protein/class 3 adenylate cyclase